MEDEEVEEIEFVSEEDEQCGIFCCKFKWMQRFKKFYLLFISLTVVNISSGMIIGYHNSMVSTFEKRFEWSTERVGYVLSANDVGYLSIVLFMAYFGGMTHRVRLIATCAFFYGVGALLYTLPYVIFGSKFDFTQIVDAETKNVSRVPYCQKVVGLRNVTTMSPIGRKRAQIVSADESQVAFALFMIAGLVQGVAAGPFWNVAFALVDDMTKQWSGVFIGLLTLLRALGPIFGYLIGSITTRVSEDLTGSLGDFPGANQKHPMWIGAWWLGYLCLGSILVIVSLPLFFFPSIIYMDTNRKPENIKNPVLSCIIKHSQLKEDILDQEEKGHVNSRKKDKSLLGFLKALYRIFTNKIFCALVIGNFFEFIALSNGVNYKAKYLENHFDISQSEASFFTAFSSPLPFLLGLICSILVSFRFQMTMYKMALYHACIHIVAVLAYVVGSSIPCKMPHITLPMTFSNITSQSFINSSQQQCHLGAAHCHSTCTNEDYFPVCSQNVTFFSPCTAGCTTPDLSDCDCSASMLKFGTCDDYGCYPALLGYVFMTIFLGMIACSARTQEAVINLRCVQPRDKALALAISSFIWGTVSSILPPINGAIFDSLCMMSNTNGNKKSYCQLYDRDKFRYAYHGMSVIAQTVAVFCFFMIAHFVKQKYGTDGSCAAKENDEQVSLPLTAKYNDDDVYNKS